jgi:nucleotide-binding universal stress UspA family protein
MSATNRDIRRIAVGVELADDSGVAVEHAVELARRHGAELILIHVCPNIMLPLGTMFAQRQQIYQSDQLSVATANVEARCAALRERGVSVQGDVILGQPRRQLVERAEQHDADLLIVGTHGRTGVNRFLMGSVAERTVRSSGIDVFVVRGEPRPHRRILVPTDFSAASEAALRRALDLIEPSGWIHLLRCCDTPGPLSGTLVNADAAASIHAAALNDARALGAQWLAQYRSIHDGISFSALSCAPKPGIQEQLESGDYNLVVMGSRGRSGLARWLLGSVAEATVRHASCSVLVVKTEEDDAVAQPSQRVPEHADSETGVQPEYN